MAVPLKTEEKTIRLMPKGKGPRTKKWLWPSVFVVLLIVGYAIWVRTHANSGPTGLIVDTVKRGDIVQTVSATGSVAAQTGAEVKIGSQITGVIKHLYADVGSHVEKGQLIAELDLPDLQAQYSESVASFESAQSKYAQQAEGVNQTRVQTSQGIESAAMAVSSDQQKLAAAQAAATQQQAATPSDIKRAQTALASAQATLKQTQAGANLQIQTAQEQANQAQANATNSAASLARNQTLYQQGYIAAQTLDQAKATNDVNQAAAQAALQNIDLVKQKVAADLETARQNVASAQAALTAAKAETYLTAQKQADVKDAQAQLRQAQAQLQIAQANSVNNALKAQDVAQAKAGVAQAQGQVAYSQAQVRKSYIRSPISGTVLQLAAQQGETLAAGLSTPNIITVADLNRLEIDAYVDESDIGKVQLGQTAACTIDAFPDRTFRGKVTKIASGSTIQQNVVTYAVTIAIQDPKHQLKPDMTASVSIQTETLQDVLLVPSYAVQVGTRGATVNVLRTVNGKAESVPVPVVTGATDGVNTQIVKGLDEGQTIVLAGGSSGSGRRGPNNPFGPSSNRGGGGGGGGGRGGGGRGGG